VRLKIGADVYDVRFTPVTDAAEVARIRAAYTAKYELPATPEGEAAPIRYWRVAPRA
jgi:hypothetical protein